MLASLELSANGAAAATANLRGQVLHDTGSYLAAATRYEFAIGSRTSARTATQVVCW